jgi:hypothetical protein
VATEGVDLVCWLEGLDGEPLRRHDPGAPPRGAVTAVVERGGAQLRFRPGEQVADRRGEGWHLDGDPATLAASVEGGRFDSEEYPDALGRVFAALTAPHTGDFLVSLAPGYEAVDWGGTSHAGGGSHGSLHREDSLGPLLFVGCGPGSPNEREQWALRDVAPIVLEHFGLN